MSSLEKLELTASYNPYPELSAVAYQFEEALNMHGRKIYKFTLINAKIDTLFFKSEKINAFLKDRLAKTSEAALKSIQTLLSRHRELVATFELPLEENEILENPYLTINGRAVCLSSKPEFEEPINPNYKDLFFSRALLREPIQCSQNHFLEKKYATFWSQSNKGQCPAGDHDIGNFKVNKTLQREIFQHTLDRVIQDQKKLETKVRSLEALQRSQTETLSRVYYSDGQIEGEHFRQTLQSML